MPQTDNDCSSREYVTKEWLQCKLRATTSGCGTDIKDPIILDCRSSYEYGECHIRSAVNLSIPSIMLRRLAAGKIDLLATIRSPELKERVHNGYKVSVFILYNDSGVQPPPTFTIGGSNATGNREPQPASGSDVLDATTAKTAVTTTTNGGCFLTVPVNTHGDVPSYPSESTISILHRRLKKDGCRVVCLQDGFTSFREDFPEWCDGGGRQGHETDTANHMAQADQLMGLRSLRISTPHSDSACSSSAESSDCETAAHHHFTDAPIEIVTGLYLGNASNSCDSRALQKYNIKYVLNVTPDLPNVFESSDGMRYLQIPITDHYSQDLAMHFPAAIKFIDEARSCHSAVLVHCLAGVSRSVTITLAYLMHTSRLSLNDAFALVRSRKPDVSPNFHFMQQLHSFERQLHQRGDAHHDDASTMLQMPLPSSTVATTTTTTTMVASIVTTITAIATTTTTSTSTSTTTTTTTTTLSTRLRCPTVHLTSPSPSAVASVSSSLLLLHFTGEGNEVSPDSGIEFDRWTTADPSAK